MQQVDGLKLLGATVAASLGTAATWLLGEWTMPLTALVTFVLMDYVSGVLAAFANGTISSRTGLKGIARKIGILMLVVVAHMADRLMGLDDPFLRTTAIWLLVGNEGVSILENLKELGVPIPDQITEAIQRLRPRSTRQDGPK